MLSYVCVTSKVTYNFCQDDIQRIGPHNKEALPETKPWEWTQLYPRQFKFLVFKAAKVPTHVRWTCLENMHVRWTCLENIKSWKKTKHVLGHAWFFFWRRKNKNLEKIKPCMFIVLEWNIFSWFFFYLVEKNIPSKSDEHGWVFFSPHKKKTSWKKYPSMSVEHAWFFTPTAPHQSVVIFQNVVFLEELLSIAHSLLKTNAQHPANMNIKPGFDNFVFLTRSIYTWVKFVLLLLRL